MGKSVSVFAPKTDNIVLTEITVGDKRMFTISSEVSHLEVNDGYHTMDEIYEHRYALFIALVKAYDNVITPLNCNVTCWKSLKHFDGTMFEDSFIMGMIVSRPDFNPNVPHEEFQITYHLPLKYWPLCNVMEIENAPKWDGHTPADVLHRLLFKL